MVRKFITAALCSTAILTTGCTALPGGARIEAGLVPDGSVAFDGLLQAEGQAVDGPVRYIFMVHGMGNTSKDYANDLFNRLEDQGYRHRAGQDWVQATLPRPLLVESEATRCAGSQLPPCRYERFGEFRADRFSKGGQQVVVYTFYWHHDLDQLQSPFFAGDVEENRGRSRFIRDIKYGTIVMGFGDAAAYLGEGGQLVREGLAVSLCAMLRDAAGRPVEVQSGAVTCDLQSLTPEDARQFGRAEFGFVSMSLGSRMLFDTLEEHRNSSAPIVPVLARRTRYFYMLANQLPLLGLGAVKVSEEGAARTTADVGTGFPTLGQSPCAQITAFLAFTACERSRGGPMSDASTPPPITESLDVVAFHDPEDLLGFSAGRGMADPDESVRFIEVWNRNAPVYLGLAANPLKTHATELEHDGSARMILCGARANAAGRLTPLVCR